MDLLELHYLYYQGRYSLAIGFQADMWALGSWPAYWGYINFIDLILYVFILCPDAEPHVTKNQRGGDNIPTSLLKTSHNY